ncbi:MAG: nucleotidyltransferase family protein [Gemmatimonadales bacterium]
MAGRRGRVGGLVLAAGLSHRFGGAKLLASFRGRALIGHVLDVAAAARQRGVLAETCVVAAAGDDAVATLARASGTTVALNPDPARGLSSSLRVGLAAMPQDVDAALLLLGDQPLVRLEVIEALVRAWRTCTSEVVRPRYAGSSRSPGHPVLISRAAWLLAERLEGDSGFGSLFASGVATVTVIDVAGDNPDVDTPADLLSLKDPPT